MRRQRLVVAVTPGRTAYICGLVQFVTACNCRAKYRHFCWINRNNERGRGTNRLLMPNAGILHAFNERGSAFRQIFSQSNSRTPNAFSACLRAHGRRRGGSYFGYAHAFAAAAFITVVALAVNDVPVADRFRTVHMRVFRATLSTDGGTRRQKEADGNAAYEPINVTHATRILAVTSVHFLARRAASATGPI